MEFREICNRNGDWGVSPGMRSHQTDEGRLQFLLFGAALTPLLLTVVLLFIT